MSDLSEALQWFEARFHDLEVKLHLIHEQTQATHTALTGQPPVAAPSTPPSVASWRWNGTDYPTEAAMTAAMVAARPPADTRTDAEVIAAVTAKIAAVMAPVVDWTQTTATELADLLTANSYGQNGANTMLDQRTGRVWQAGAADAALLPADVIEGKIIRGEPVSETERAFYKASRKDGDWGPYSTVADPVAKRIVVTRTP